MKNLPFVIWVLGWPLVRSIELYIERYLLKEEDSKETKVIGAIIFIVVWIWIGSLLYQE